MKLNMKFKNTALFLTIASVLVGFCPMSAMNKEVEVKKAEVSKARIVTAVITTVGIPYLLTRPAVRKSIGELLTKQNMKNMAKLSLLGYMGTVFYKNAHVLYDFYKNSSKNNTTKVIEKSKVPDYVIDECVFESIYSGDYKKVDKFITENEADKYLKKIDSGHAHITGFYDRATENEQAIITDILDVAQKTFPDIAELDKKTFDPESFQQTLRKNCLTIQENIYEKYSEKIDDLSTDLKAYLLYKLGSRFTCHPFYTGRMSSFNFIQKISKCFKPTFYTKSSFTLGKCDFSY